MNTGKATRQERPTPFEADRARKGRSFDPELSVAAQAQPQSAATGVAIAVEEPEPVSDAGMILGRVLDALEKTANADNLVATLSEGVIAILGNELTRLDPVALDSAAMPYGLLLFTTGSGFSTRITFASGPLSNSTRTMTEPDCFSGTRTEAPQKVPQAKPVCAASRLFPWVSSKMMRPWQPLSNGLD